MFSDLYRLGGTEMEVSIGAEIIGRFLVRNRFFAQRRRPNFCGGETCHVTRIVIWW
jgi:hypothetical protein